MNGPELANRIADMQIAAHKERADLAERELLRTRRRLRHLDPEAPRIDSDGPAWNTYLEETLSWHSRSKHT